MSEESPKPNEQSPPTTSEMHEDTYVMPQESPPTTSEMHEDAETMPEQSPPTTSEMHEDSVTLSEPSPSPQTAPSSPPIIVSDNISAVPPQEAVITIAPAEAMTDAANPVHETTITTLPQTEAIQSVAEVREPLAATDHAEGLDPLHGLVAGAALVAGGIVAKLSKEKRNDTK